MTPRECRAARVALSSPRPIDRRDFLALAAASVWAGRRAKAAPGSLRFMALGQSLILRDLASQYRPGFDQMRARLGQADVAFSDLECAIRGASAKDSPSMDGNVVAAPAVLDSLEQLPINLLALSNNHAGDLGEAGVLSTIEETRRRGFTTAGTGRTLAEAASPAFLRTARGTVALVAMASNAVSAAAIATDTRPGVNHVAMRGGAIVPEDAARVLAAIRQAATQADQVVVYQHDHYWARDWQQTPDWKKTWCRACIDAGAAAFISHGVPLLHGIEIYKRRPIFYGLGNFVFHLSLQLNGDIPAQYAPTPVWQSVIADCQFEGGTLTSLWLDPITLESEPGVGEGGYTRHGNPRLAEGVEAHEILDRLAALSKDVGTAIEIVGSRARVRL